MAALAAAAEAALPPPILVTDVNLGGDMDGLALVAELRRRWPEAGAVVMMTRHPPDLDIRRRDPREVWLVKPFGPLRLTATIHELMDRSRG
jgi:DNA-binding response OmpR family regulator